jgi:hypothetical protein
MQTKLVVVRVFLPDGLPRDQRVRRGGGIRHRTPFDAVEMHDLGAGGPGDRAVAPRHVALELRVDIQRSRHALIGLEAEGAAADQLRHLAEGIGVGQALRHHGADGNGRLAERDGQQREGVFQVEADGAVVRRGKLVRRFHQRCAEGIAPRPAADGGDAVARQHAFPIVPQQPLAQREVPQAAFVLDGVAIDHLRRRLEIGVHAVERVEDHVAVVAADVAGGGDGIERHQVLLRREFQRRRRLRADRCGAGEPGRHAGGGGTLQNAAAVHDAGPLLAMRQQRAGPARRWQATNGRAPARARPAGVEGLSPPALPSPAAATWAGW